MHRDNTTINRYVINLRIISFNAKLYIYKFYKMWLIVVFSLILRAVCNCEYISIEEKCVTNNLEEGFDEFFTNNPCDLIDNSSTLFSEWDLMYFNATDYVNSTHYLSTKFLTPASQRSCIATKPIRLIGNGRIEINIHLNEHVDNYLNVLLISETDSQIVEHEQNLEGILKWDVISVNIDDNILGNYTISLIGAAGAPKSLIVDSIRFLPHELLNTEEKDLPKQCQFYPVHKDPPRLERTFWVPINIVAVVLLCLLPVCLIGLI